MRGGNLTVEQAAQKQLGRVLEIYQRDYEAILRASPATFEQVLVFVKGTTAPPPQEWLPLLEEKKLDKDTTFYLWREPLFVAFAALPRGVYDETLYFELQLLRLLFPLVERLVINEPDFTRWFHSRPKDDKVLPEIYQFLAERRVDYLKKQARANRYYEDKAALSAEDWLKSGDRWINKVRDAKTGTPRPLRLIRELRNNSLAHDETDDGKHTQRGCRLIVKYLGSGDRKQALLFLREARSFFQ
jgi:hypothetical protein